MSAEASTIHADRSEHRQDRLRVESTPSYMCRNQSHCPQLWLHDERHSTCNYVSSWRFASSECYSDEDISNCIRHAFRQTTNLGVRSSNLFGCAISPNIVENAAELPSARPSFHDVPTKRLHNAADDQALSCSKTWDNRRTDVYTKRLHIVRTHPVEWL